MAAEPLVFGAAGMVWLLLLSSSLISEGFLPGDPVDGKGILSLAAQSVISVIEHDGSG